MIDPVPVPRHPGRPRIRPARPADAQTIAQLSRDVIETGLGWSWTPARVRQSIVDRDSLVIVAGRGATVAGFAILQVGDDEGHLSLLAVDEAWRRRGVGRRLVEWLMGTAACAGLAQVRLELRSRNEEARQFYEAMGFDVFALSPGYYRGQEAALRMARRLRPEGLEPAVWEIPAAWRRVGSGGE